MMENKKTADLKTWAELLQVTHGYFELDSLEEHDFDQLVEYMTTGDRTKFSHLLIQNLDRQHPRTPRLAGLLTKALDLVKRPGRLLAFRSEPLLRMLEREVSEDLLSTEDSPKEARSPDSGSLRVRS